MVRFVEWLEGRKYKAKQRHDSLPEGRFVNLKESVIDENVIRGGISRRLAEVWVNPVSGGNVSSRKDLSK
jgi:hypothetical protein